MRGSFLSQDTPVWFNNELVAYNKVKLGAFSHSLGYATSFYEGIRAFSGQPYKLQAHLNRLSGSASILGIELPFTEIEITQGIMRLLESTSLEYAYIKIMVFLDDASPSYHGTGCVPSMLIGIWDLKGPFLTPTKKLKVAELTKPSPQAFPYQLKGSAGYLHSFIEARTLNMNEDVVFLDSTGHLCEASGSNILIVNGNRVRTPAPIRCLEGITCKEIIEIICPLLGFEASYNDLTLSDLHSADEIILCGTAIGLSQVLALNSRPLTHSHVYQKLKDNYVSRLQP